jgi:hypothetical protein
MISETCPHKPVVFVGSDTDLLIVEIGGVTNWKLFMHFKNNEVYNLTSEWGVAQVSDPWCITSDTGG